MTTTAERAAVSLRPATEADQATIRRMVRRAQLDPTGLHWSHFVMAEAGGQAVGIGQIRPRARELGSLVVLPAYQKQGIGGRLIRELLTTWPGEWPIYLECIGRMVPYYQRFGFYRIPWQEAPFPLNVKGGLGHLLGRVFKFDTAVMRIDALDDLTPPE